MSDRISPPDDLEQVLDDLKKAGIFATKQKGLMFAASVGWAQRKSHPAEPPTALGEGIRVEYFERPRDLGFVEALAVTEAEDLLELALDKDDARIRLFEAYANVGLRAVRKACFESGVSVQQGILNLIDLLMSPPSGALPGLDRDLERLRKLTF